MTVSPRGMHVWLFPDATYQALKTHDDWIDPSQARISIIPYLLVGLAKPVGGQFQASKLSSGKTGCCVSIVYTVCKVHRAASITMINNHLIRETHPFGGCQIILQLVETRLRARIAYICMY